MTVIRMAFTQSVPIGSTNETTAKSAGPPNAEIAIPPARPVMTAMSTRLAGDMRAVSGKAILSKACGDSDERHSCHLGKCQLPEA
jgi:hypothetical protein